MQSTENTTFKCIDFDEFGNVIDSDIIFELPEEKYNIDISKGRHTIWNKIKIEDKLKISSSDITGKDVVFIKEGEDFYIMFSSEKDATSYKIKHL